ncbi:MAG TPA: DNA-3-methyladenine glycosylase I [Cycloclasticus sp.]|jgi:DNA-3-methyladenine glycosylase I|nr:DNA-3-methyladenine glycosylase I [Cycloclasticus sp.]HIL91706.1 DNA-3-methyladenine glycosylase I [Cycloclasticus sp.]
MDKLNRCSWAKKPLDIIYHDTEWGVPLKDEHKLFEFLILEGVQAGLSWSIVLQRREDYRQLYDNFDPAVVANYSQQKIDALLSNATLIRNKLKINASVKNAKAFLQVQNEFGSFSVYLWGFVDNKPIINHWQTHEQVPNETDISIRLSRDLKKRGFSFVGPTICYALMQATGLVNDHLTTCFRHSKLK